MITSLSASNVTINPLQNFSEKEQTVCVQKKIDSALVCYYLITENYSLTMNNEDKRYCIKSYLNLGYIYYTHLQDISQTYTCAQSALDICLELNDREMLPNIYLNMTNIFDNEYDFDRALEFYRKAYYASYDVMQIENLLRSFQSMMFIAFTHNRFDIIQDELQHFAQLDLSDHAMKPFTLSINEGMGYYRSGDLQKARQAFMNSLEVIDMPVESERFQGTYSFIF